MASLLQIQRSKLKKQQSDNKIPNNRTRRFQGRIQYWNAKTKKWQNTKAPSLKTNTSTTKSSTTNSKPSNSKFSSKQFKSPQISKPLKPPKGSNAYVDDIKSAAEQLKKAGKFVKNLAQRPGAGSATAGAVVGLTGAAALARGAGKSGSAKLSRFGISKGGNAPTYNNPLNPRKPSGLTKNQQETLSKQNAANRLRKNEQARARKVGNPTAETRAIYNKTAEKQSGGKVTGSKSKTTVTKAPKRDRMEGKSSSERLKAWALANKTMILKSGTKKQKAILNKVLNLGANDLKRYSTSA